MDATGAGGLELAGRRGDGRAGRVDVVHEPDGRRRNARGPESGADVGAALGLRDAALRARPTGAGDAFEER